MQKNAPSVSLLALYKLFFGVGLFSFGGGLTAWFHREVVLVRGWMTNDEFFSGYSLAQLIETSLISGHFAEQSNRANIDIFSHTPYPPYRAAQFCRSWFGAATVRVSVTLRQAAGRGTGTLGRAAIQQLARNAYP